MAAKAEQEKTPTTLANLSIKHSLLIKIGGEKNPNQIHIFQSEGSNTSRRIVACKQRSGWKAMEPWHNREGKPTSHINRSNARVKGGRLRTSMPARIGADALFDLALWATPLPLAWVQNCWRAILGPLPTILVNNIFIDEATPAKVVRMSSSLIQSRLLSIALRVTALPPFSVEDNIYKNKICEPLNLLARI